MTSNRFSPTGIIIFPVLLLIILSSGCNEKKQVRGDDIVPREVLIQMMVDMHLIDGITNDVKYYRKYNPNDSIDLYGQVFDEHGYSRVTFDSTLKEYARYPYLLDELYNDVMMKLNLLQDQLNQEDQERADLKKKNLPEKTLKTR